MQNKSFSGKSARRKITVFFAIGAAALLLVVFAQKKSSEFRDTAENLQEPQKERRLLDGVLVAAEVKNPPLAGVMIENMADAQPVSGVAGARLVFEALTEANITRFLAYFIVDDDRSVEIGPVRSARPYYLDWAAEFAALYAHVGSSPAAYEMLRKTGVSGIYDLDQWYKSGYFFFKEGRPRPHHIYTTTELLSQAYAEEFSALKSDGGVFESWRFKDASAFDLRGDVREILVAYKEPYGVTWQYGAAHNGYRRLQWSGAHRDASGREIRADNIAVAFQDMKVLDSIGRKEFNTIGEGNALVFQDGRVVEGFWRKSSPVGRMRFYDSAGTEVSFNAGITWVHIVPQDLKIVY